MLKKSGNKKKVLWADTSAARPLEQVHHFFLDEAEKALKKSGLVKGADMAKIERLGEKELRFKIHNGGGYEAEYAAGASNESEQGNTWPAQLIKIDLPDTVIQAEIHSVENEIQKIREANTLAVLMFKQFLPDSPSEPTEDSKSSSSSTTEQIQSKVIPLEDITQQLNASAAAAAVNDTKDTDMLMPPTDNHAHSSNFDYQNRVNSATNRSNHFENPFNNKGPASGFNQQFRNNNNINHKQYNPTSISSKAFNGTSNEKDLVMDNGYGFGNSHKQQPQTATSEPPKEETKAPVDADSASNILNIVSKATVFLQSDETAEKIKQILKQIGSTPASASSASGASLSNLASLTTAATPVAAPAPLNLQANSLESVMQALLAVNKNPANENSNKTAQQLMSIPINSTDSPANEDSGDRSPGFNNNKFGNNRNFSNDNNNFRKSKWNNPGNGNYEGNNWNKSANYRNNNNSNGGVNADNNNRTIFVNNHKRGMGNRGGYNDFRGGKGGFGRGNGGMNPSNNNNNNDNPRWQNFNNNNNNRGGRFGAGGGGKHGYRPNFNNKNDDHDKNHENNGDNPRRRSDGDNEDWSDMKHGGPGGRRNSNNEDHMGGNKAGGPTPMPVPPPLPMVKANTTTQGGTWR